MGIGQTIWTTPQPLFDLLNAEFGFTLDACADPGNEKCPKFYQQIDSLIRDWRGNVWLNPPYGATIGLWIEKAYKSAMDGAIVVCLLPGRTNAPWWHEYVMRATEIRFVRKKLNYAGGKGVPFFGSVVAVFRPGQLGNPKVMSQEQQ